MTTVQRVLAVGATGRTGRTGRHVVTAVVRDITAAIFVHGSDDDASNLPLDSEPGRVRGDLTRLGAR